MFCTSDRTDMSIYTALHKQMLAIWMAASIPWIRGKSISQASRLKAV